ncbi:MAG: hypothetical protein WHT08_10535 [Bryobacteraceae bacterium]
MLVPVPDGWPSRQRPAGPEPLLFPAPPAQWRAPESILGPLQGVAPAHSAPASRFPGAFNGPVYAMQRLHAGPRLFLTCRPAWYFDSLETCERLEREGRYRHERPPERRAMDGSGRTAAIGISTVMAWRAAGGWRALAAPLAARSMPQRAGLLHVVPSGMLAPPYSIAANVRRELQEELGLSFDPRRLWLAGAALNPLNQRPEICTVYVCPCRPGGRLNAEFAPRLVEIPLTPRFRLAQLGSFFPAGAAALVLAARLLFHPCRGEL